MGPAGDVGVAQAVGGDREALVGAAAAQVGGVDQLPIRVKAGNDGVLGAAALVAGGAQGEVGGLGPAGQVAVAGAVDRDAEPLVGLGTAQVGGVVQGGVDDQWTAAVIGVDREADDGFPGLVVQDEAAADRLPAAVAVLVGRRLAPA